jgi:hypothetical protein
MANRKTLIAAKTAAENQELTVTLDNPVTLSANGLGASESIPIHYKHDASTYFACYRDGVAVALTPTNNPVTIYGPGEFRVAKGITAGAVSVSLYNEE